MTMALRLGAFVIAVAALVQPAPLSAVSHEFDLTYDPATAVVAGTQVISFSRSEFGDLKRCCSCSTTPAPYPIRTPTR